MTVMPQFATRADAVADHLRRAILGGEYEAGARLRQADLAVQLGVSTTPVREALVSLLREGFLTGDPHKGVMVRQPNVDELSELYEIRLALEPLATAKAAKRITREQADELDELLADLRRLAASGERSDGAGRQELHTAFHARIYEISGRPRLAEMVMGLRAQSAVYVRMFPVEVVAQGTSDEQHATIIEALRSGSAKRAAKAMRDHLEFNEEHIAKQLQNVALSR